MEDAALKSLVVSVFDDRPDVVAVYLFGSQARGTADAGSDIDLGVLFHTLPHDALERSGASLAADVSAIVGREVDVVVMNSAPVDLIHRIFTDGIVILDRDRPARIAFEVRSRREYFDLLPMLQRYRKQEQPA